MANPDTNPDDSVAYLLGYCGEGNVGCAAALVDRDRLFEGRGEEKR